MIQSGKTIARGYLFLVAAEVVAKGVTFAAFGFLARHLGTTGQGFVEFAIAVTMCASLVIDLGFNPYGAREIARDPSRTTALVGEIVLARLGLAIIAAGVVIAIAFATPRPAEQVTLLLVYALSLLPMPLVLQWVFQGHNQMAWVAIATVLRQMVFAATVFALVRGLDQVVWVAIGEVAGVMAAAIFCVVIYWRRFGGGIPIHRGLSRQLFREGVPIGLGQMFWAGRMFAGTILLGYIATSGEVGEFGAAHRILVAVHTFVWWYFFNLLPTMTQSWQSDRDAFRTLIRQSLSVVLWIGLLGVIPGVLLARPLMTLTYGVQFTGGAPVLAAFAGVCLLLALSGNYRFGLIAAGHQKTEMITAGVGAVAAVMLISAGYWRWGIAGAGLGLLAAELLVWAMTWWCSKRLLETSGHLACYGRPMVTIAIVVAFVYLMNARSVWITTAVSCGIVIIAALLDCEFRRQSVRFLPLVNRRSS